MINLPGAPALPAPIQFGAPPAMQRQPLSAQGMAILQAALKGRPQVAPPGANPNAPVNPGAPPAAGDPAYFPGGAGPMAGGPAAPQVGMLSRLFGGGTPAQAPTPMMPQANAMAAGDLGGW